MKHSNENLSAHKGKHLFYSERSQIAILKQEDYANRCITNVLARVAQMINNEGERGTITQRRRQN